MQPSEGTVSPGQTVDVKCNQGNCCYPATDPRCMQLISGTEALPLREGTTFFLSAISPVQVATGLTLDRDRMIDARLQPRMRLKRTIQRHDYTTDMQTLPGEHCLFLPPSLLFLHLTLISLLGHSPHSACSDFDGQTGSNSTKSCQCSWSCPASANMLSSPVTDQQLPHEDHFGYSTSHTALFGEPVCP